VTPSQYSIRLVAHDAPQPCRKRRWLRKLRQHRPGGNQCFLHHVLGLLQIMDQCQRRAESQMLEAVGELHEGFHITLTGTADERFEIHRGSSHYRCQETVPAFMSLRPSIILFK
jgi:hypothetical protein